MRLNKDKEKYLTNMLNSDKQTEEGILEQQHAEEGFNPQIPF